VQTFYDTTYVAKHLGVSKSTVINWVDRPTAAFPMPSASVRYGDRPRQENPAWIGDQLTLLREWLAHRLGLSDPEAHWALIDNGGQPPGGHQDQGALFDSEGT
jgi:transposase